MKNNKKIIFFICITIVITILMIALIRQKNRKTEIASVQNNENIDINNDEEFLEVKSVADMLFNLDTTEKISEKATVMVKGKVIETRTFTINDENPQVITLAKVWVEHDYKENIASGKEIYFVQHGGIVPVEDLKIERKAFEKSSTQKMSEKAKVTINGAEVSKLGDEILFFADIIEDDFYNLGLEEKYYETVGDYQGRFILNRQSNEYIRQEPELSNNNVIDKMSKQNARKKIIILNEEDELKAVAKQ